MSTMNERDALRQALLEAVQGIEPGADALRRIRARLSPPRPLALAWAEAASTFVQTRGPSALQEFAEWLRSVISEAWARFGPRSGTSGGRASRAAIGWLRPVAALGVTVFIVAAGVYGAISAQEGISSSASSNSPHSNGGGAGGGGSHGGGGGLNTLGQSTSVGSQGSTGAKKPACKPRRSGNGSSSAPSTGPSTSPSMAPSNSSGSASASPSVTMASPTPGVSTTGLASPSTSGSAPATGSTSQAAGSHGTRAPSSPTTSGQSRCSGRRHPGTPSPPGPTPSASPADVGYAKLDDGI